MKHITIRLLLITSLLAGHAHSREIATPPEVESSLRVVVSDTFTVIAQDAGDINGDGKEDWVGVIKIEREAGPTQQLYVLIRNDDLKVEGASKEVEYLDCGGSCYIADLKMKNNSFFIQINSKNGYDSISTFRLQFKQYKGEWRAIGRKTSNYEIGSGVETESDENLLTGFFISTTAAPTKKQITGHGKPEKLLLKDFDLTSM